VPGLELGAARFYHTPWPANGLRARNFVKPFEAIFKINVPSQVPGESNEDYDNQLASLFFRWVFPGSGFEVYGEYGREDHSWDLRDFLLEPDHASGYMLGLRKLWWRGEGHQRFITLRGEVVNLQISTLVRGRQEVPFYVHGYTRQGHTYRGQMLGADVGNGGAAESVGVDYYHARGRWTLEWSRVLRQDVGDYWRTGVFNSKALDVVHSLAGEGVVFWRGFDITGRLAGAYEFNRDFQGDAFNLNVIVKLRARW
jgi:hypothetical protein